MAKRYEVRSSITREKAQAIIRQLAEDDEIRAKFEKHPRTFLFEHRIDVTPESLPETITLPPKEKIAELIELAEELAGPTASPFGFLLLFVVFGAMPVVTGARPADDVAR
jgi:hypothetical protein